MILTTNITTATETSTLVSERISFPQTVTGPSTNNTSAVAVYKLTGYKYKYNGSTVTSPTAAAQIEFDEDKENIRWVLWVDGGLMNGKKDYIIIENKALTNDATEDFTEETDKTKFIENIKDNAYIQATSEVVIEGGNKINKLTIKFSKWLDGKNVYIEAYRNGPDHNTSKTYVKTTAVTAAPEILEAYWLNAQGKKITSVGYSSAVNLGIKTLGLVGENLTISLYDYDSDVTDSDLLQWNGGGNSHLVAITGRHTLVPYNVEAEGAAAYSNAFGDEFDSIVEVFVKIESTNTTLQATLEDQYARIDFTPEETVNVYLASKDEVTINGNEVDQYNVLTTVYPGMTAYLVAETTNLNATVSFSVTENTSLLVAVNTKVPLLIGTTESTDFTATITDNFAVVEVKFQELNSTKYDQWVDLLVPSSGSLNESIINIKATINTVDYDSTETFKIEAPIVTQKIYHDGKISQENYIQDIITKVKLEYHNNDTASPYDFGIFDVTWAQKWIRGTKTNKSGNAAWKKVVSNSKTRYYEYDGIPGVNKTPLVNVLTTAITGNTRKKFEIQHNGSTFIRLSEDTSREYFNPERLAGLLGAIIDCGHDDIITNGSVDTDGTGAYSVSHVNGNNIDFKYLRNDSQRARIDITGGVIYTDNALLDKTRQNEFLDSLEKFGFHSTQKSLSWYFDDSDSDADTIVDDTSSSNLLNHCKTTTTTKKKKNHHDHLHLQGFKANYKTN